ncbi:MAG: hypothetical protein WCI40_01335 [Verrucomicrobiota bacterium]
MSRLFLFLLVLSGSLFVGGCATEPPKPTDSKPISTMPFNRVERWEGAGMMGGMMGTR